MNVELEHFSRIPIGALRSVEQQPGLTTKPVGLWVGVKGEGGWEDWCRSNGLLLDRLIYRYDVALAADANILCIGDNAALDAFDEQFGGHREDAASGLDQTNPADPPLITSFRRQAAHGHRPRMRYIDWQRVAADYDGILVAPVIEARRSDPQLMPWYYSWDADGGCIWNVRAIGAITPNI